MFMFHVRLCYAVQPCDHLLRMGSPFGSLVCCFLVLCHFPIWCLGPGVVLDCIDF